MRYVSHYYRYLARKANEEWDFPLIYWRDACGPWVLLALVPILIASVFAIPPKNGLVNAIIIGSMAAGGAGAFFALGIYVREDWRRNARRRRDR